MKIPQRLLLVSIALLSTLLLLASASQGQAADEPKPILLWPNGAPGSEGQTDPERVEPMGNGPERKISRIHFPSITPYLPEPGKATGAAVLIAPGGAHRFLAIDHEGHQVGRWLAAHGIAGFVLKNRLARDTNSTYRIDVEALADTQRAVRLIRSRAVEWKIQPGRVGVLGFSAGGELASLVSLRNDGGNPAATDPVERHSCRPDFQALIYPGRSGDIQPATNSPPAFLAAAYGDRKDISEGLAEVYLRFKRANVPAELHLYSVGGHGFGLRDSAKTSVGRWADRFADFLGDHGFLAPPAR